MRHFEVVGAFLLVSVCACNAFEARSDDLQCTLSTDCLSPRVCEQGYCVVPGEFLDASADAVPETDADPGAPDADIGSTVTFTDDFSSGEWRTSEWLPESLGSNSRIEVADQEGRLFFGTSNPAWARATLLGHDTTDTDLTLQFRFEHAGTEGQLRVFLRASGAFGASGYPERGYAVVLTNSSGALTIQGVSGGTPAILASASWTTVPDLDTYTLRFQVAGTTLRARVWPSSSAEPSTWNAETSDAAIAGSGDLRVEYFKVSSARGARVDNISLTGE